MSETTERAKKNHKSIAKAWEYLAKYASHIDGEVANANDDQLRIVERLTDALAAAQRENARLRAELENIARANWRTWDPEMRSPDEFVRWAQSRATAALRGEGGA